MTPQIQINTFNPLTIEYANMPTTAEEIAAVEEIEILLPPVDIPVRLKNPLLDMAIGESVAMSGRFNSYTISIEGGGLDERGLATLLGSIVTGRVNYQTISTEHDRIAKEHLTGIRV